GGQPSGGEKVKYTAEKGAAASSALSQFIAEGARYGDTKVVNVDGQDYLAKFEEHTIFGADPSKTPRPHPSVGLYPVKGSPPPANTEGTDSAVA
ncbi:MAG TPA: hypothetical protein P5229_01340, partial [Candidatus Gracilibacteria bacterium]|nr:hypothetical protein [Candidatus Gracilibacteria bacterium]